MSVFLPSDVLGQFAANVEAVVNASPASGKFTRSAYRYALENEPDGAPGGLYFLDMPSIQPHLRRWGDGSQITDCTVVVRLLYSRPGGNAGGGDRQSVLRDAADDCSKLADVCENPANYGSSTSGIRTVTFQSSQRVSDKGLSEIWEVRFSCQWESDMGTTTVVDLTQRNIIVDTLTALEAYNTNSLDTGSKAFSKDVWRTFTLKKDDTQTPNGSTIVFALGGGNWLSDV